MHDVTLEQVAHVLGVTTRTILTMVQDGRLPPSERINVDGHVRRMFSSSDLELWTRLGRPNQDGFLYTKLLLQDLERDPQTDENQ